MVMFEDQKLRTVVVSVVGVGVGLGLGGQRIEHCREIFIHIIGLQFGAALLLFGGAE